jgi:regulator of RNase E activity RraA
MARPRGRYSVFGGALAAGRAIAAWRAPPPLSAQGDLGMSEGQCTGEHTLWGGITTICARLKGIEAVVIDGAIRDVAEIERQFARAAVPNAGAAEYRGDIDVPVQCGGAVVNPGDWVTSDEDGIVVIPAGRLAEVIQAAERLRAVEAKLYGRVRKGEDLAALLRFDELIAAKQTSGGLPQMRLAPGRRERHSK